MARKKKWIQQAIKNQMLLLSDAKGKALAVPQKNILKKANAVQTLPHGVGSTWLKL